MNGILNTSDTESFDLRNLFGVIRRQGRVTVFAALAVVTLALVYLFSATPQYQATTLISIQPNREVLSDNTNSPNNASSISATVDGEVEILKSTDLLWALAKDQNLLADEEFGLRPGRLDKLRSLIGLEVDGDVDAENAVFGVIERLQNAVTVRRKGLTYLIEVSFTSQDAAKAADLANALSETYIRRQVQRKVDTTNVARDILRERVDKAKIELESVEGNIDQFMDVFIGEFVRQTGREDLQVLQRGIQSKADEIAAYEERIAENSALLQSESWDALNTELMSEATRQLLEQRKELNARLLDRRAQGLEVTDMKTALAALDADLQRRASQDISETRRSISETTSQRDRMREDLRLSVLSTDLPSGALADLYQLQQEGEIARSQYQDILGRLRQLDTLATIQLADASVVSQALAPNAPALPNKKLVLSLALVFGAGLGVCLAFLNEYLIGGFISEDQLRNGLHSDSVHAIPNIASNYTGYEKSVADLTLSEPLSPYSESLRKIRKSVDKSRHRTQNGKNESTVILMTSTVPGEGKTTTSLGLARTFALSGHRTCVVDLDLRKPSLADHLGLEKNTGLLDYMAGSNSASDLPFAKEDKTGLFVIAGGARASVPTDALLGSPRLANLLDALGSDFDYIIIDSAPILPVVDTLYLAKFADVIVNLVRYASTNQGDVRSALNRIADEARSDTPIIQVLFKETLQARKQHYDGYYSAYAHQVRSH